ncbi:FAD dependent oxidoreductase [Aphelenchoides fujianensis]|nr:FAD dependent oxidoreductase [Aphelenchoides fujianensis]
MMRGNWRYQRGGDENAINRPPPFRRFTQSHRTPFAPQQQWQQQQPPFGWNSAFHTPLHRRPPFPIAVQPFGGYSYDFKSRALIVGHSECRLLKEEALRMVDFDLSKGVENFEINEEEEAVESKAARSALFRFLLQLAPDRSLPEILQGVQFVTMRSVLVKVALGGRGWSVLAVKLGGKIFLCDVSERAKWKTDPKAKLGIYCGKVFEKIMSKAAAHSVFAVEDGDSPPGNGEAYYAVFRVAFGDKRKFSLLVSAETDGVDRHGNFVEFKSKGAHDFTDAGSIDRPTWLQSYFVGIERMFVGLKAGTWLKRVVEIRTSEIPPAAKWSTERELGRLEAFLGTLQAKFAAQPDDSWLLASSQPPAFSDVRSEAVAFKFLTTAAEREPFEHFVPAEVYGRL